jgi:hypothetical protein
MPASQKVAHKNRFLFVSIGTGTAAYLCDQLAACGGTETGPPDLVARCIPNRRIFMRSKLAISVLVAASMFGVTTIASAQTQSAPGASSEGTTPAATSPKTKTSKMTSSKAKSGTTTGMSKSKSSGQNGMESGTDNSGSDK